MWLLLLVGISIQIPTKWINGVKTHEEVVVVRGGESGGFEVYSKTIRVQTTKPISLFGSPSAFRANLMLHTPPLGSQLNYHYQLIVCTHVRATNQPEPPTSISFNCLLALCSVQSRAFYCWSVCIICLFIYLLV